MRIRKGLLLSSSKHSWSQTASDPQLKHLVQPTTSHELHPITIQQITKTESQPSDPCNQPPDHPPKILGCKPGITSHKFQIKQKVGEQVKLEEASRDEEEEDGASSRRQNIILAAAPLSETVLTPLGSRQVDERWFDVDKKIPMNKRKGVDMDKMSQETLMLEKAKRMKSKTNKKCSATSAQQNDDEQVKAGNNYSNTTNHNMNIVKKTNKKGGAIMEGSRCSRVNGRGWRCCQQTLVGYSLCEHHLGKGRLRSIANVKGRAKMPAAAAAAPTTALHNDSTDNTTNHNQPAKKVVVSSSMVQPARDDNKEMTLLDDICYDDDEDKEEDVDDDDDYNDEEMKKPLLVRKKRMKLGVMKARSLSSLLNQTNNAVAIATDDN